MDTCGEYEFRSGKKKYGAISEHPVSHKVPILGKQPPRQSLFSTPDVEITSKANSTPYRSHQTVKQSQDAEKLTKKMPVIKPRRLKADAKICSVRSFSP